MKHSIAVLALLALTGCAFTQDQLAADAEEILAQAGFERHPLEEPGLPARKLVEDAGVYKFADRDFCQCVYLGGAEEYAELQRLRARRIADRDWALRHGGYGNTWDPIVWGAWKPQGLDAMRAPLAGR